MNVHTRAEFPDLPEVEDLCRSAERSMTLPPDYRPNFKRPLAKQEAKEKARAERDYYKAIRKRLRQERGFEWRELRRGLLLGVVSTITSAVVTMALLVISSILQVR